MPGDGDAGERGQWVSNADGGLDWIEPDGTLWDAPPDEGGKRLPEPEEAPPPPSTAGKPWDGMSWRDSGTREWRESLTDEEVDEWWAWQEASEEWEDARAPKNVPPEETGPPASPEGTPWDGMDWRDGGTPEWRQSLTYDQSARWRRWQRDMERWEREHPGEPPPAAAPALEGVAGAGARAGEALQLGDLSASIDAALYTVELSGETEAVKLASTMQLAAKLDQLATSTEDPTAIATLQAERDKVLQFAKDNYANVAEEIAAQETDAFTQAAIEVAKAEQAIADLGSRPVEYGGLDMPVVPIESPLLAQWEREKALLEKRLADARAARDEAAQNVVAAEYLRHTIATVGMTEEQRAKYLDDQRNATEATLAQHGVKLTGIFSEGGAGSMRWAWSRLATLETQAGVLTTLTLPQGDAAMNARLDEIYDELNGEWTRDVDFLYADGHVSNGTGSPAPYTTRRFGAKPHRDGGLRQELRDAKTPEEAQLTQRKIDRLEAERVQIIFTNQGWGGVSTLVRIKQHELDYFNKWKEWNTVAASISDELEQWKAFQLPGVMGALTAQIDDPKGLIHATVGLLEGNVKDTIKSIDAFVDTPFYSRGIGYLWRLGNLGEILRFAEQEQDFATALRLADTRPVSELPDSARRLLEQKGFIKDGEYATPANPYEGSIGFIATRPNWAWKLGSPAQIAELLATVVIPGGAAARATMWLKFGAELGWGARIAVGATRIAAQGTLFTLFTNITKTGINPLGSQEHWKHFGRDALVNITIGAALEAAGIPFATIADRLRKAGLDPTAVLAKNVGSLTKQDATAIMAAVGWRSAETGVSAFTITITAAAFGQGNVSWDAFWTNYIYGLQGHAFHFATIGRTGAETALKQEVKSAKAEAVRLGEVQITPHPSLQPGGIPKGAPAGTLVRDVVPEGLLPEQAKVINRWIELVRSDKDFLEAGVTSITIEVRRMEGNVTARRAEGAAPKPEPVKSKSINEADVAAGYARREDVQLTGSFNPKKVGDAIGYDFANLTREQVLALDPKKPPEGIQASTWDAAVGRVKEWWNEKPTMDKLAGMGLLHVDEHGRVVDTGVSGYRLNEHHEPVPITVHDWNFVDGRLVPVAGSGRLLRNDGKERFLTGDPDIFIIRDQNGASIPAHLQEKMINLLAPADVMHGFVAEWHIERDTHYTQAEADKNIGIREKILGKHRGALVDGQFVGAQAGAEPLIRFGGLTVPRVTTFGGPYGAGPIKLNFPRRYAFGEEVRGLAPGTPRPAEDGPTRSEQPPVIVPFPRTRGVLTPFRLGLIDDDEIGLFFPPGTAVPSIGPNALIIDGSTSWLGDATSGTWTLEIEDFVGGGDGVLNTWTLHTDTRDSETTGELERPIVSVSSDGGRTWFVVDEPVEGGVGLENNPMPLAIPVDDPVDISGSTPPSHGIVLHFASPPRVITAPITDPTGFVWFDFRNGGVSYQPLVAPARRRLMAALVLVGLLTILGGSALVAGLGLFTGDSTSTFGPPIVAQAGGDQSNALPEAAPENTGTGDESPFTGSGGPTIGPSTLTPLVNEVLIPIGDKDDFNAVPSTEPQPRGPPASPPTQPPAPVAHTITIEFVGTGDLTVAGQTCVTTCTVQAPAGTQVTINAPGATFTGDATGADTLTFVADGPKRIVATFSYPVTLVKTGDGTVRGLQVGTTRIAHATTLTIEAEGNPGSKQVVWDGACAHAGNADRCTVVVNGPTTIIVTFVRGTTPEPEPPVVAAPPPVTPGVTLVPEEEIVTAVPGFVSFMRIEQQFVGGAAPTPMTFSGTGLAPPAFVRFTANPSATGTVVRFGIPPGFPVGDYPVTIDAAGGDLTATITVLVQVKDFRVSAAPPTQTVNAGESATYAATLDRQNGFEFDVDISVSGLPADATAAVSPNGDASDVEVTTSTTTPPGTYTLTIRAQAATTPPVVRTTTVTLTVDPPEVAPRTFYARPRIGTQLELDDPSPVASKSTPPRPVEGVHAPSAVSAPAVVVQARAQARPAAPAPRSSSAVATKRTAPVSTTDVIPTVAEPEPEPEPVPMETVAIEAPS